MKYKPPEEIEKAKEKVNIPQLKEAEEKATSIVASLDPAKLKVQDMGPQDFINKIKNHNY